jgi:DNA-binding transcriptional LysR family regulator
MTALPGGLLNNASILSLRCFAAVVETQSFSSAAKQLRLAPSSVTKHVQLIEKAVNVALVHRTTRRVSVTDAGERFYDQCLAILAQVDRAAAVMAPEKELSGHLRVTAPPSFVAAALGPRIPDFLRAHPGLSLDVAVSSALPDLIRARIDVAVTLGEAPQSKLTHFLITACPMVMCASPEYVARYGTPIRPEDLVQHACLSGRFSDLAQGWTLGRAGKWEVVNGNSRLLSDNGELLRQACLGGAGIGSFYRFHVQNDLRTGSLISILENYEVKNKNLYAVIPHRQIIRPQARAFIDFLRKIVSGSLATGNGSHFAMSV